MRNCPDCINHQRGINALWKCVDAFGGLMLYCTVCGYRAYFNIKHKRHTPTKEQLRLELAA